MGYPDFSVGEVLTSSDMDRVGLWRIFSNTFSGAPSYQFNNLFTADFLNYRVDINFTTSVGDQWFRLSASGTPNTTNNYVSSTITITTVGTTGSYGAGTGTIYYFGYGNTNQPLATSMTFFSPQTTNYTRWTTHSASQDRTVNGGGAFNGTNQFDGLFIQNGGGTNVAGRITVYGFNNNA